MDEVNMMSECTSLSDRFNALKRQGLVDVKFLLRTTEESTPDAVCAEVDEMLCAFYDRHEGIPLDFQDRHSA